MDYDNTRKVLKKYCVEVGVTPITLHELRHSYTELWIANGATVEDSRRLLHHKSSATTARYIHRTDDRLRAIAEGIDFGM